MGGKRRMLAEERTSNAKQMKPTDKDLSDHGDLASPFEADSVLAQFCSESGITTGPPIELPLALSKETLQQILNVLLKEDENTPYSFFVDEKEVRTTLESSVDKLTLSEEKILKILYQPQAVFRVRAVTRCTSSLPGHAEPVIHASFSPNGKYLASGSGDATVRFWDINTETPQFTCKGHKHWVLATAWSTDGERLASACKAGQIIIWNPENGKQIGRTLSRHKDSVRALVWEPLHLTNDGCSVRLASAGEDGDVRIWDTRRGVTDMVLSGHKQCVYALRWGGDGLLYSASRDQTIKMWRIEDGVLVRTLQGETHRADATHAHWVNTIALSTDYVLRTGASNPKDLMNAAPQFTPREDRQRVAMKRYKEALEVGGKERLVSGSDDRTLFLWEPQSSRKPLARMSDHNGPINDVKFSPDTRTIASASFDKTIRLWDGITGKLICVLNQHIAWVYLVAWSADSRLLVSCSEDSTLKVWSRSTKKLEMSLPGHADRVFALDWSPDGNRVVSGGQDKVLKIWRR